MAISKELKARWLERLRSPEAKWASETLVHAKSGGMCCLGHLADIQGHLEPNEVAGVTFYYFNPPLEEIERLGLTHLPVGEGRSTSFCSVFLTDPETGVMADIGLYGLSYDDQENLATLNDERGCFPIAEIEALPTCD